MWFCTRFTKMCTWAEQIVLPGSVDSAAGCQVEEFGVAEPSLAGGTLSVWLCSRLGGDTSRDGPWLL